MRQLFSALQYGGKRRKMTRKIVAQFVNRKRGDMVSGCLGLSQLQGFIVSKQLGDEST